MNYAEDLTVCHHEHFAKHVCVPGILPAIIDEIEEEHNVSVRAEGAENRQYVLRISRSSDDAFLGYLTYPEMASEIKDPAIRKKNFLTLKVACDAQR